MRNGGFLVLFLEQFMICAYGVVHCHRSSQVRTPMTSGLYTIKHLSEAFNSSLNHCKKSTPRSLRTASIHQDPNSLASGRLLTQLLLSSCSSVCSIGCPFPASEDATTHQHLSEDHIVALQKTPRTAIPSTIYYSSWQDGSRHGWAKGLPVIKRDQRPEQTKSGYAFMRS